MSVALILPLYLAMPLLAQAASVDGVRMWAGPDDTRLVFDISGPVDHSIFMLRSPDRVVLDLKNARLKQAPHGLDFRNSLVSDLRSATRNGDDLRLVLDLKTKVRPKSFLLKPTQQYGHRLVIDLQNLSAEPAAKVVTRTMPTAPSGAPRDVIIAIDAGHGGEDPGASGQHGTREKEVVLAIARRLAELVEKEPGMKPLMIRDGDYYLGLRKRMQMARDRQADLFISIHADAFRDGRASGASVYVLSQNGATSEAAQWLARSENDADLIGGVSLDDKDDLLRSVLLDLSQNATIAASLDVGGSVLKELGRVGKVHKHRVEQAGFVVLKSPDIPSILVETGYISNKREERNLRDRNYQHKLALAMLKGVRRYFTHNAPPGTRLALAEQEHVIRPGETLGGIAAQYQVSQLALRSANRLSTSQIKIGQILRIPTL
ncbi:MAG: N-acetylmuramoyl-L-alanine amidase [Gammaproteobacteria bacterium]|nr:N-acetylmuramoyl-L-alanine amidase [Gammaproteobacteria bacterium]